MSVINQVLQDLAKRSQESGDAATKEELSNLGVQDKIIIPLPWWKKKIVWWIAGGSVCLISSLIGVSLVWKHYHEPPILQIQPLPIKKLPEPVPPVVPPVSAVPAPQPVTQVSSPPAKVEEPKKEMQEPLPVRVMSPEQILAQKYSEVMAQIQAGQLFKAEEDLKQMVEEHPSYQPAIDTLISIYLDSARYDLAEKLIHEAQSTFGDTPDLRTYQAQLLFDQGHESEALNILLERTPNVHEYPGYYALLAGLYLKKGEYGSAERYYQQLLAVDASRSLWWFGLAEAYYGQQRYQEAKYAYQQALNYNNCPPSVRIYIFDQLKQLE